MFFIFVGRILNVGQCLHEGCLPVFVSYGVMRVTWKVYSVELVEKVAPFFERKTVVNWNYTDASLLQELNVSLRDVAGS